MITIPVHADDILILASDGLSDNLWDEDVLDEVLRFRRTFLASPSTTGGSQLPRRTLAGMLSEALCSRARTVSQRRCKTTLADELATLDPDEDIPFARRAREAGRTFSGGKSDGGFRPACPVIQIFDAPIFFSRYLGISGSDFPR